MNSRVSKFDDWLNGFLEECAREAGQDVGTYVARAVAAQMVADQRRANSHSIGELMAHLADSGAFAETTMPSTSAVITDPARLRALYATGLLDSPPEAGYDRIARAAAGALDAPRAALTLIDVDRQFFKSTVGMDGDSAQKRDTPLDRSICQYTVANGATLILEDARSNPIFKNHPAVIDGSVVAYLGAPLLDSDGHAIGTLCVYDERPRSWSTGHVKVLSDLANLAAERIFAAEGGQNE